MQYSLNEKALIWLNLFSFLTLDKKHNILSFYENPQDIFSSFKNDYKNFEKFITKQQFNEMLLALNEEFLDNEILNYNRENISVLTYLSKDYPQEFLNYEHYPICLYAIGDLSLLKNFSIAVVGTRKISKYGRFATEKITRELCQNGVTIVSGMATGVDTVAHTTCLENNGKTIAVLGSGFHHVFPKSNFELFKKICQKGLVITEYNPEVKPLAYNFPVRNRIIALLSKGVLMTEAGLKSGALYTINYGIEYGKEIFAVPGNIDSYASQGCNKILKSCQSAIATCGEDILNAFNLNSSYKKKQKVIQLSFDEQNVINTIDTDELSFDEIQAKTKYDTKILVRLLTTLELSGIIKKSAGNFYSVIYND